MDGTGGDVHRIGPFADRLQHPMPDRDVTFAQERAGFASR
ncbi:hypothetical protein B8V81_4500 [Paenibacillus pasadenensis]|uniref:Uncharacterized protein n=1 Tax=Paenibacillus pasadenensis TaxID=217090 RepID=A0A2N5N705_9BACL|nr:hypothetical protein B8V81_4500 [Paenibacillus pasadenensis]